MMLAVGVVTYNNSPEDLARFARAFQIAQKEVQGIHEVFLYYIDNGQTSNLHKLLPAATPLTSEGNLGYTRSMNRLMKTAFESAAAPGPIEAFITANPDGAFHHATFKSFVEQFQATPDTLLEARQFPEEHAKIYDPLTLDTPWCSGCCIFIPKKLYQTVGVFDENFFMYMEDVDYSWRTRALGFGVKLCPQALYFHSVVARQESEKTVCHYYMSARYLGWKWGHSRYRRWAEKTLLNKKGYTKDQLQVFPDQNPIDFSRRQRSVACFERVFSFAEKRW
jgi:GT2 family glycosyltransferase